MIIFVEPNGLRPDGRTGVNFRLDSSFFSMTERRTGPGLLGSLSVANGSEKNVHGHQVLSGRAAHRQPDSHHPVHLGSRWDTARRASTVIGYQARAEIGMLNSHVTVTVAVLRSDSDLVPIIKVCPACCYRVGFIVNTPDSSRLRLGVGEFPTHGHAHAARLRLVPPHPNAALAREPASPCFLPCAGCQSSPDVC
jgi:hypothetical protein